MTIPRGIVKDEVIATKVKEWFEDEQRTDYDRETVMDAIATAHARVSEEKPDAARNPNIYGLHLTKFIRQELGLKP